jgi:protein-L-isoaspartate(D-aspartate) O-methyltransferase
LREGWKKGAPFDVILLDGAVEEIPATLVKQLTAEGRLAGAIVDRGVTRLVVGRAAGGSFGLRSLADADVDILPGFERPRAFTF